MLPQLQESPGQPWELSRFCFKPTSIFKCVRGGIELYCVSSAAPMKHMILLGVVDDQEAMQKSRDAATAAGGSW
jgi:hypothetical protein